jgi:hypothetical protein
LEIRSGFQLADTGQRLGTRFDRHRG